MGSRKINVEVESIKNVLKDQTCSNCGTDRLSCKNRGVASCEEWSMINIEDVYIQKTAEMIKKEFDKYVLKLLGGTNGKKSTRRSGKKSSSR